MDLTVVLQGETYQLAYTEEFVNKLEEENGSFNAVIEELRCGEEEVMQASNGEPFFFIGKSFSFEGVRKDGVITLTRLIPSGFIL